MCIVKANAYGHGIKEVAKLLDTLGADAFAVADIDESTDAVLNFMAYPSLGIKQNVYGLAFGYVQSGKTAHYLGVLNKAADDGRVCKYLRNQPAGMA